MLEIWTNMFLLGTGAICIYALLLAKIYGCHMIGTEVDRKSVEYAEKCIRRNNLQDLIKSKLYEKISLKMSQELML